MDASSWARRRGQVAESSLEELKETYRELKRMEEKTLRAVREAEQQGKLEAAALDQQADALRNAKMMWAERLAAAQADRQALFKEAQAVEQQLRAEKERKQGAQASAAHYRALLRDQM